MRGAEMLAKSFLKQRNYCQPYPINPPFADPMPGLPTSKGIVCPRSFARGLNNFAVAWTAMDDVIHRVLRWGGLRPPKKVRGSVWRRRGLGSVSVFLNVPARCRSLVCAVLFYRKKQRDVLCSYLPPFFVFFLKKHESGQIA